jgi:hypothetical protein
LIQIENLTKYYGKHLGDSADPKIGQSEVSGFIGSNGAADPASVAAQERREGKPTEERVVVAQPG